MSTEQTEKMMKCMDIVSRTLGRMHYSKTDGMQEVCKADDIMHVIASDGKTSLGAMLVYKMADGIELVIDTYKGVVTASFGRTSYSKEIFTDTAGYQMAASDLFWGARS